MHMNVVILSPWVIDDETQSSCTRSYTSGYMCRMDLIQNALDRGVSQVSQECFLMCFGPFLVSPGGFQVKNIIGFLSKIILSFFTK